MTPTIGRSHGIHAEPMTFGLKLAQAYAEFSRARDRLIAARQEVATCAISGAVGTFAQVDPRIEAHVAAKMGLTAEPISTQVIPRDRHAMFFATLGVVASSIERLAIEIRHLQRTEVLEAEEFFSEGQKGSSSMPHKRNPVLSENLTGLARMVRAYVTPALENVALWHERDISHSSVERMIGPDATVTLDFALARLTGLIDKLVVYPENMQKNLDRLGGLVHSQRVLLALTQKGASREDAYRLVQRNAMQVWRGEGDFLAFLKADKDVTTISERCRDRRELRPRLSPQARRYDLPARVRRIEALGSTVRQRPEPRPTSGTGAAAEHWPAAPPPACRPRPAGLRRRARATAEYGGAATAGHSDRGADRRATADRRRAHAGRHIAGLDASCHDRLACQLRLRRRPTGRPCQVPTRLCQFQPVAALMEAVARTRVEADARPVGVAVVIVIVVAGSSIDIGAAPPRRRRAARPAGHRQIAAARKAGPAAEAHLAPASRAAADIDGLAAWHRSDDRVLGAWAGAHVEVGSRDRRPAAAAPADSINAAAGREQVVFRHMDWFRSD